MKGIVLTGSLQPKECKRMKRKAGRRKALREFIMIAAGCIVTAAAINVFLVPFRIAPGGVAGIATVLYYLSDGRMPVGTTMLILNIPLFAAGFRLIGRRFLLRTLFAAVFLSAAIDLTEYISGLFVESYLSGGKIAEQNPDLLLYALMGGALMGTGLGLVFRSGATTGGTDLAARLANHFLPSFTMGKMLLLIDAAVIVFAAVTFRSFRIALYAAATLFVASTVIDALIEGVNFAKALFIISENPEEISRRILTELDRGVTALKGLGMYTGRDKNVLFCVVHRSQLPLLKKTVKSVDEKAFLILTDVREVLGEGFKNYE